MARAALRSDDGDPFYRAGIVDDGRWTRSWSEVDGVGIRIYDEGGHSEGQAEHIARWDPARVLAEVAAKRAVLDEFGATRDRLPHHGDALDIPVVQYVAQERLVRALASIWKDHPDYDSAWA